MPMDLVVVHAFVDVHRSPFVVVAVDIQLVNSVEQDQAGMHLVARAEHQVSMDAGNLDLEPVVLVNFYHLFSAAKNGTKISKNENFNLES